MKFFFNFQKTLKNGFYVDYFFKNFIFYFYKKLISNNLTYLIDKYLAEKLFFMFNQFFKYLKLFNNFFKNLSLIDILKIIVLITIQLLLVILL